jgi:hypothetical protein
MKLTPAEYKLMDTLDRVVGNTLPMEWLKPAQRSMVLRMRRKGLLSKRHPHWAKWTDLGRKSFRSAQP